MRPTTLLPDYQELTCSCYSYAEFVQISKEVSVIENEMLEFKDCLAEWKNMPSLLHIEESSSAAGIVPL